MRLEASIVKEARRPSLPPKPRAYFPLHRAQLGAALQTGDARLDELLARPAKFGARHTIIAADRDHPLVHRIRSGWCCRARYLRDGRVHASAVLLPGDLFGVRSLFFETQTDEVSTITEVQTCTIEQAVLRCAAANEPDLMMRLAMQMAEQERRLSNWVVALSRGTAEERMALLLIDVRARLLLAGTLPPGAAEMPWPLTQQDMANALGLTAVHVNRTIKHLRERNFLSLHSRSAKLDVQALHTIARPLLDIFERQEPAFGGAGG